MMTQALTPAEQKRQALLRAGLVPVKLTAYEQHAFARVAANDNSERRKVVRHG